MVRECFFFFRKTRLCLHMEGACRQTSDEMDRPTPTEAEAETETQSECLQCLLRLLAAAKTVVSLLLTFNEFTEH